MIQNLTPILTLILVAANVASSQTVGKCGNESSLLFGAKMGRPLAVVDHKVFFPENKVTAEQYCTESKEAIAYAKNFSKNCLSDLPRQANSLIAYGMNKAIKKSCKSDDSRRKLHQNLGCFNKVAKQISKEYKDLGKMYQRSIHLEDRKQKIPSACCNFFNMKKNMLAVGATKCNEDQVEYLKFFVDSFSGDVLDLLCAGITLESDKCKNLALPSVNVTKGMQDNDSFFPALIVLLNGL